MNSSEYTDHARSEALARGADLAGIVDTEELKDLDLNPPDLLDGYTRAVSLAIRIPDSVFEAISDRPTPIYSSVYKTANRLLDEIAFKTAAAFQKDGFKGLPIPASQIVDSTNLYAAISHKAVARLAGLGWQGKSLLLVTPQYGPRVRLVTVLTDAPLDIDMPIKNRCGDCTLCRDACPAKAIKGVKIVDYYRKRDEALHFYRCVDKVTDEYSKLPGIGATICGICIKVCPAGKSRRPDNKTGKQTTSESFR